MEEFKVTPWEAKGEIDYDRLIKEFGIKPFNAKLKQFNDNILFRRGSVFAHRDMERIENAIKNKKPFVMMTGLMPSGKFHFGHKMVADQIVFYQSLGAKIYLAVADIEAYNTRLADMEELRRVAIEEYLVNYIALGLKPKSCDFYFQSERSSDAKKSNAYYRLAEMAARHATANEVKAIYGDITPGKLTSALLQVSDILHPQLEEFEGQTPVIVPVGIDQDPHLRLARDIAARMKSHFDFILPSSTYNRFLTGLKGGKMSSSDPLSYVALTETPEEAKQKIMKHAFSGGRDTIDEHRKLGGVPEVDVSYQWLYTLFEEDDKKIKKRYDDYKSGKMLTGELKNHLIDKISTFLDKHQKARAKAKKEVGKFIKE
ncbi:TPA: tryptophan--tRNA ligase [archaeon]|nr:tryptophan--tRNA ligase [Candidatus Naiadarchaeales archaeon SRR2090159.bin1288]